MLQEFKKFALRGNVIDLAVGFVMGASFGTIVKSLVDDILMPPVGLLLGGVDFSNLFVLLKQGDPAAPYISLADAKAAGAVTINYGLFLNTIISFLLVAAALFLLIRAINRLTQLREKDKAAPVAAQPTTKECPYCLSAIPIKAIRCPQCTSTLPTQADAAADAAAGIAPATPAV